MLSYWLVEVGYKMLSEPLNNQLTHCTNQAGFGQGAAGTIHPGIMWKGRVLQWHAVGIWDGARATTVQALAIQDFSLSIETTSEEAAARRKEQGSPW